MQGHIIVQISFIDRSIPFVKFWAQLTILVFTSMVFAQNQPAVVPKPTATKKESYKDIIQKAQNLTLQLDRLQAAQVLTRVIKSESYNKKAQEELKKNLNDIATVFYTEKTQRLFEYAKFLLRESPQEAKEKYMEALKIEPDNILILLGSARLYLYEGKCEDAEKAMEKALEIDPFYPQLELADLQAKACLQNAEEFNKALSSYKHLETIYPLYYQMVLAQKFFNQKQYVEATDHIEKAKQIDKEFPEIYFWESQILEKQELVFKNAASRYIRSCKTATKTDFIKYELEPRLCQQYKTFEVEYKNVLDQENKKDI